MESHKIHVPNHQPALFPGCVDDLSLTQFPGVQRFYQRPGVANTSWDKSHQVFVIQHTPLSYRKTSWLTGFPNMGQFIIPNELVSPTPYFITNQPRYFVHGSSGLHVWARATLNPAFH